MIESNTIFWDEVKPDMKLEAKDGSWFADGKLVYWTGETAAEARAFLGRLFQEQRRAKPDLELKALEQFSGTEKYRRVLGFNVTDGIAYLMENGYSYFVTDLLSTIMLKPRLRHADFLVVTYTVDMEKHIGRFEIRKDSNQPILYSQRYEYTDAKRPEIKLFYESGVLLLAREH